MHIFLFYTPHCIASNHPPNQSIAPSQIECAMCWQYKNGMR